MWRTLSFILRHPNNKGRQWQALARYIWWQVSNIFYKRTITFQMVKGVKLHLKKGLLGASGNYYCGLHEYNEMTFLLKHLKAGQLFVDVGANIGSYSMLAAAGCGAQVIAFEPVAAAAAWIARNAALNSVTKQVTIIQKAVGANNQPVHFSTHFDTTNQVTATSDNSTVVVPQTTLDEALLGLQPVLIKIDVEGYESAVVQGMQQTLKNPSLRWLIIEIDFERTEDTDLLFNVLAGSGFNAFNYEAANDTLVPFEGAKQPIMNVIFER